MGRGCEGRMVTVGGAAGCGAVSELSHTASSAPIGLAGFGRADGAAEGTAGVGVGVSTALWAPAVGNPTAAARAGFAERRLFHATNEARRGLVVVV